MYLDLNRYTTDGVHRDWPEKFKQVILTLKSLSNFRI